MSVNIEAIKRKFIFRVLEIINEIGFNFLIAIISLSPVWSVRRLLLKDLILNKVQISDIGHYSNRPNHYCPIKNIIFFLANFAFTRNRSNFTPVINFNYQRQSTILRAKLPVRFKTSIKFSPKIKKRLLGSNVIFEVSPAQFSGENLLHYCRKKTIPKYYLM